MGDCAGAITIGISRRFGAVSLAVRVGVLVMPTDPWPVTRSHVRHLDTLGYHHLWIYDHLMWRHYRDHAWHGTYPWLSAVAAVTSRIRLGTMVANPNLRHPFVLARDAATIDHVSDGRFTLGIGAGGVGVDAGALGQDPLDPAERAERLDEYVDVVDRALCDDCAHHEGRWYQVHDARMALGCVQRPRLPVIVAATGRRTLDTVARRADGWITHGDPGDPTVGGTQIALRRQIDGLERACAAIGRDPAEIDRYYLIGHTDERPLVSVEAFADFAGRYAELGFTDLVFHHPRPDDPVWNEPVEIVDAIAERIVR